MEILDLLGFDVNPSVSASEKLHRANERTNLLVITKVVLKGFLEESLKLRHRMLDSDIQYLSDLLMMLEKVLWHGFKGQRNILAIRPPDAELWRVLSRISTSHEDMNECVRCINNLDNLVSIDLSSYIRFPTLPSDEDQTLPVSGETSPSDLKTVLDQKSYLEERNRYLEKSVNGLKKKVADLEVSVSATEAEASNNVTEISAADKDFLEGLEKERDCLIQLVKENNDTINTLRQQLTDTKKVNEDLYTKVRMVEEKCKLFENELISTKERYIQEKEQWLTLNEILKSRNLEREAEMEKNSGTLDLLKNELFKKTEEYMDALDALSKKQVELNSVNLTLEKVQKQNSQSAEKLRRLPVLEQEIAAFNVSSEYQSKKIAEYEKALEELGVHLSESGLRILELKEEFLPFSEAQWQDDAEVDNCKACNAQFSVSRRKHHCRSCGLIFCNSCSDARVKLPSNPKPARVCVSCYNLLRSRQNSAPGNGK